MNLAPRVVLALLTAASCSSGEATLRGTLAEPGSGGQLTARLAGHPGGAQAFDSTFEFSGIPPGPLELRFAEDDDELGRIGIADLPSGATLSLERIRIDEDENLAFPSAVQIDGADLVTVNGIRMGNPDALPGRVKQEGTVLAINRGADRLLVRPVSEELPDLPVVITPATRVISQDGDSTSLRDLSRGDSLRVEGRGRSGYLYAEQITMTRAGGEPSSPDFDRQSIGKESATRTRTELEEREQDRERGSESRRDQEREEKKRDKKEKRDERRGSERGRSDIPAGHRSPPGECRDWNPNLPPGQQPPPRKC